MLTVTRERMHQRRHVVMVLVLVLIMLLHECFRLALLQK
jgi:hypothetical protein